MMIFTTLARKDLVLFYRINLAVEASFPMSPFRVKREKADDAEKGGDALFVRTAREVDIGD